MKKKKNNGLEISVKSAILLIVGTIALIFLIVGAFYFSQESHFKITKEGNCWDKGNVMYEFREINLTLEKPEATSINKELVFYRALQKSDLPNEGWFDYGTSYRVLYEDEEKVIINVWLKTVRAEERIVCEPIEVEEIIKPNKTIWKVSGHYIEWCEGYPKEGPSWEWYNDDSCNCRGVGYSYKGNESYVIEKYEEHNGKGCKGGGTYPYEEVIEEGYNISKQNLPIEWLDENCECENCYIEGIAKDHLVNPDYCNDDYETEEMYCSKYKCEFEETYLVEIK